MGDSSGGRESSTSNLRQEIVVLRKVTVVQQLITALKIVNRLSEVVPQVMFKLSAQMDSVVQMIQTIKCALEVNGDHVALVKDTVAKQLSTVRQDVNLIMGAVVVEI